MPATVLAQPLDLAGSILRSLSRRNAGALACALQQAERCDSGLPVVSPDLAERLELLRAIAGEMRASASRSGTGMPGENVEALVPLLRNLTRRP